MRDRFVRCAVVVVLGLAGLSWLLGACRGPSTPPGAAPGGATTRPPAFEIELVSRDTGAPIAGAKLEIDGSASTREEMLDRALVLARERKAAGPITEERGLARESIELAAGAAKDYRIR